MSDTKPVNTTLRDFSDENISERVGFVKKYSRAIGSLFTRWVHRTEHLLGLYF